MSLIFLYIVHHIIFCLGLASSIVIDIFIILVEKTKKIRGVEKNIMERVMSYSFLSSLFVFILQLMYVVYIYFSLDQFSTTIYIFTVITFLMSAVLLFCTTTQKYYQFKILERNQEKYHHLSDSFIHHHKEFRRTSIITLVLWLALYIAFILI
jgi:small-conductance mechanosensitive channel